MLDPADAVHGPRRQVFLSLVDGFLYYYYYFRLLPPSRTSVRLRVRLSKEARASRWISQPSWARILGLLQWSGSSVEGYQARSVDSSISSPRPLIFHPIQSGACALPVLTPAETVQRRPNDVRPLLRFAAADSAPTVASHLCCILDWFHLRRSRCLRQLGRLVYVFRLKSPRDLSIFYIPLRSNAVAGGRWWLFRSSRRAVACASRPPFRARLGLWRDTTQEHFCPQAAPFLWSEGDEAPLANRPRHGTTQLRSQADCSTRSNGRAKSWEGAVRAHGPASEDVAP